MRFQDKTEDEQRAEIGDLIQMYAKSNGDPVPREDRLNAAVEQILNTMKTSVAPACAAGDVSLGVKNNDT